MMTGHSGNGARGPDLAGPENQQTAARSGVAAITAGQTLIRTFGCNSCADNGSADTEILGDLAEANTAALLSEIAHLLTSQERAISRGRPDRQQRRRPCPHREIPGRRQE